MKSKIHAVRLDRTDRAFALRPDGRLGVQTEDLSEYDAMLGTWEVDVSQREIVEVTPRRIKITGWRSHSWTKDILKA